MIEESQDLYTTRNMLPLIEEIKLPSKFLKERYFGRMRTFESKIVEFDLLLGRRQKAIPIHFKQGDILVGRLGFKTYSLEAPYFCPSTLTTAEDVINYRQAGEHCYSTRSLRERLSEIAGRDLRRLESLLIAAEEDLCAQILFYGKLPASYTKMDKDINLWEDLAEAAQPVTKLAGDSLWSGTKANPLKDLRTVRRTVIQRSGISPREAIMGTEAIEAFLAYLEKSGQVLDNRRLDLGFITPENLPEGVTYWGNLRDSGLDIYSYDATVTNADETEITPVIPAKAVLVGSQSVMTTMCYGACPVLEGNGVDFSIAALPRVPSSYVSTKSPVGKVLRLATRPLPIVHEVQGFHVLWPLGYEEQAV